MDGLLKVEYTTTHTSSIRGKAQLTVFGEEALLLFRRTSSSYFHRSTVCGYKKRVMRRTDWYSCKCLVFTCHTVNLLLLLLYFASTLYSFTTSSVLFSRHDLRERFYTYVLVAAICPASNKYSDNRLWMELRVKTLDRVSVSSAQIRRQGIRHSIMWKCLFEEISRDLSSNTRRYSRDH